MLSNPSMIAQFLRHCTISPSLGKSDYIIENEALKNNRFGNYLFSNDQSFSSLSVHKIRWVFNFLLYLLKLFFKQQQKTIYSIWNKADRCMLYNGDAPRKRWENTIHSVYHIPDEFFYFPKAFHFILFIFIDSNKKAN